jgi:hypothetical protein
MKIFICYAYYLTFPANHNFFMFAVNYMFLNQHQSQHLFEYHFYENISFEKFFGFCAWCLFSSSSQYKTVFCRD